MDGRQPPEQADIIFEGVEGVYGPKHTPMLRGCITAGTKKRNEGHKPPQHPQHYPIAQGVVAHQSDASARGTMPHVGC